jgi:hypothetical protein
MPHDEHVLMRPVLRGVFRMESLLDGTLALEDVYWANDALNLFDENERRMQRALESQQRR